MNNKLIFFIGLMMLSSFSSFLLVTTLHLPCLIELFLLPLWFYKRQSISLPFRDMMMLVFFILFGTFIGLLNPIFSLDEILQMSRCFFLGGLGFVLLKNNELFASKDKLIALTFGAFIGDLLNAYISLKMMLGSVEDKEYAIDINIILSILWAILIVFYKRSKWLVLLLVLVPILCFLSVSRGISTFFILGITLAFIFKTLKSPSKIFLSIVFLTFAFISLSYIYEKSEDAVRAMSPSMHFRLYTKTKNYGKSRADGGRIAPYIWLKNHLDYYAFPRGFQGKKFVKEKNEDLIPVKNVWDSAYLEVLYTFGLFPFLVILVIYLYKLYQMFIYYQRCGDPVFAIAIVMFLLLLIEHFFGYGLYRSPFTVFCNGALLGFIWRISERPETVYGTSIDDNENYIE